MITYVDTSIMIKLLVEDEVDRRVAVELWMQSDHVACAEIGYVEARAALAAAHRRQRIDDAGLDVAKNEFESLWKQVSVVKVDAALIRAAADLAESEALRGYDALHLAAAMVARAAIVASADRELAKAAHGRGFAVAPAL